MRERILNRNTAFRDLTRPDILKRIDIDEKLIPIFVNVMNKFQDFFDEKGLMSATNFALFFETHLIGEYENKFSIELENTSAYIGKAAIQAGGIFKFDDKKIIVDKAFYDERYKEDPVSFESVLAHEFIHFLAMTDLPWIETKDGDFVQFDNYFQEHFTKGGFIAEGFTQMLTEFMYPQYPTYYPYTSMVKMYLNAFSTEDYLSFLRGRLPGKTYTSEKVDKFMISAEKHFMYKYYNNIPYETEIASSYYQETFNYLVDAFKEKVSFEIERFDFVTAQEFAERIFNFKSLTTFESKYLESATDQLITEYVSTYYPSQSINKQLEIKQDLRSLIDDSMKLLQFPSFIASYVIPSKEDGYFCRVENYDECFVVETYSPDSILLKKDFIPKTIGLEDGFNLTTSRAVNDKIIEFKIDKSDFRISIYDIALSEMSDEEFSKLKQEDLPITYTISLTSNGSSESIAKKVEEANILFDKINDLVKDDRYVAMRIIRRDQNILSLSEVKGVFEENSDNKLFVSVDTDDNIKFYYTKGAKYAVLKSIGEGLVKLPITEKENLLVSGKLKGSDTNVSVVTSDEYGENHKKHKTTSFYRTSRQYYYNLHDKEEYKKYTEYDMEK